MHSNIWFSKVVANELTVLIHVSVSLEREDRELSGVSFKLYKSTVQSLQQLYAMLLHCM